MKRLLKSIVISMLSVMLFGAVSAKMDVVASDNFDANNSMILNIDGETLIKQNQTVEIVDDEYFMVTEEYSSLGTMTRAVTKTITKTSTRNLFRSSDGKKVISWVLTATFDYNGKTSSCTKATGSSTRYVNTLTVGDSHGYKSGMWASQKCSASTAKMPVKLIYGKTRKIGIKPDGTYVKG